MHHHFFNYKSICTNDFIFNETTMLIQKYKKIQINIIKQKQHITISLFNIAYIIDYPMNFVSMNIVKNKKIFCNIKHYERYYLLKNNMIYCIK